MTDKRHWLHCSEKSATFFPQRRSNNLNNAMDKNRILSSKNVCNLIIIICSLFVGVNCVANKSKFDLKPNLLEQKNRSFILSLFPRMLEL